MLSTSLLLSRCMLRLQFVIVMAAVWLVAGPLWAQEEAAAGPPSKSYGMSYALTGLCLVLGVMLVCRPFFPRRDKIERPTAEE